jgi:small subunit ribosomal protein S17
MKTQARTIRRTFNGVIISNKMNKTLVVQVDRTVVHPKYGKRYVRSEKYHVHADHGEFNVGDKVSFYECRPISKTKRWTVVITA